MSDFLTRSSSATSSNDMNARKEAMMNSVRQELALANAQELMNKASERCFSKCVTKPGDSLSSSEQVCLVHAFLSTANDSQVDVSFQMP
ncbi:hypothetical protein D9613_007687 [Agrocybe pediades]|uniref:Mitochondrial import inner membrane translocase subunit n=1 Tax=Agrocybe pediades TaxID=84607 RepID=A0A8H4QM50_9AGAR|nr:hypothetical protein D9613_007687 [Agrocybe pediades]